MDTSTDHQFLVAGLRTQRSLREEYGYSWGKVTHFITKDPNSLGKYQDQNSASLWVKSKKEVCIRKEIVINNRGYPIDTRATQAG